MRLLSATITLLIELANSSGHLGWIQTVSGLSRKKLTSVNDWTSQVTRAAGHHSASPSLKTLARKIHLALATPNFFGFAGVADFSAYFPRLGSSWNPGKRRVSPLFPPAWPCALSILFPPMTDNLIHKFRGRIQRPDGVNDFRPSLAWSVDQLFIEGSHLR